MCVSGSPVASHKQLCSQSLMRCITYTKSSPNVICRIFSRTYRRWSNMRNDFFPSHNLYQCFVRRISCIYSSWLYSSGLVVDIRQFRWWLDILQNSIFFKLSQHFSTRNTISSKMFVIMSLILHQLFYILITVPWNHLKRLRINFLHSANKVSIL